MRTATTGSTPLPSSTSLPLLTPTQIDEFQAETEIRRLLQNNDVCSPPCYLGIIPDRTEADQLRRTFARWGIELYTSVQDAPAFYVEHEFGSGYLLNASFLMRDNLVESIGFVVRQTERLEWETYSPVALLEYYGAPSQISFWIGSIHEPSPTPWKGWYHMIMSYDELELHIEYGGVEVQLDEMATVCPHTDLYGSGRVWLGKYPFGIEHITDIQEAASITPETFHDYLLKGPGACVFVDVSKVEHL